MKITITPDLPWESGEPEVFAEVAEFALVGYLHPETAGQPTPLQRANLHHAARPHALIEKMESLKAELIIGACGHSENPTAVAVRPGGESDPDRLGA